MKNFILNNLLLLRRLSQLSFIALLLLAPVFDILRYDTAAQELYIFGAIWELGLGSEFYADPSTLDPSLVAIKFFLKGILPWLVVLSVFPLLGFLLGRSFCGWACPEGALFELADHLTLGLLGRRSIYGAKPNDPVDAKGSKLWYGFLSAVYLLIVPPIFGIFLSGFFIAPDRIWSEILSMSPSFGLKAGVIGVSLYMFITFILVRHTICKYLCGAGLMQMLFGLVSPMALGIRFDMHNFQNCTDCRKCERACFMDIRPRSDKKDINCVNCGECISACKNELGDSEGLFHFTTDNKRDEKLKEE